MIEKADVGALLEQMIHPSGQPIHLSEYDVTILMKLANRLKKYQKDQPAGDFKIAVLGTHSIQHFVGILNLYLYASGIHADIYEGEYDGINMDVLDSDSELFAFAPQVVILMTHYLDIKVYPALLSEETIVGEHLAKQIAYYQNLWSHLQAIPGCQILQTNFVVPLHRELGNLEANYGFTESSYLHKLNAELAKSRPKNVTLIDMDYIASAVGKIKWFDYSAYFLTKAGFRVDFLGIVAEIFAREINAMKGKTRKCLVMDLDNTLWGGVVGDDGWDGIEIDPHNAIGEAYRYFQNYILHLKNRGVILAVCSKNEPEAARAPFEKNENMILKLSDIASFQANWNDKAGNIRAIAKELNIGLDSLVFVDDNPAEREIVRTYLPEVMVVELPEDPAEYVNALEKAAPFEWMELTREDLKRSDSYQANQQRSELMESFVNYEEYLQALHMEAKAGLVEPTHVERFAQLINKSNQFNLRTQRYTEAQIEELRNDSSVRLLYVDLKDKFTGYGIISCIILRKQEEDCFVDTWLMSCRVLKRGVEDLAFEMVREEAKSMGCTRIIGEYIPSAKNAMVKNFYSSMGFEPTDIENRYVYFVEKETKKTIQIKRI